MAYNHLCFQHRCNHLPWVLSILLGSLFIDLLGSAAFSDSIYLLLSKSLHVPFHLRQLSSVNQHGEQIHAKVLLTSRVKAELTQLANQGKGMNLCGIIFSQKIIYLVIQQFCCPLPDKRYHIGYYQSCLCMTWARIIRYLVLIFMNRCFVKLF